MARSWQRGTASPEAITARRLNPSVPWWRDEEGQRKFVQALFAVFLIVVLVRITNGAADSEDARETLAKNVASGDTVKQIIYFTFLGVFASIWVWIKGASLPRSISLVNYTLIGWIFLSVLWSADPAISFRRAVLLVSVFTPMAMSIDILGQKRSIATLYWVLAISTSASLLAVFLHLPFARHPMTENDLSIIGGWRGVFSHKNIAGAICGVAALLFLQHFLERRRWYDLAFFIVCIVFIIGSKSKTPRNLIGVAIAISLAYRYMYFRYNGRVAFWFGALSALAMTVIGFFAWKHEITAVFDNRDSFTGRVGIWEAVMDYSRDHRLLGAGYNALWATNRPPPILPYINEPYEEFIAHSHNGYFELLGTLGVPGLILGVTGAILLPLSKVLRDTRPSSRQINAITFSVVIFCVFENFFETQLYSRDREIWLCLFIIVMCANENFRDYVGNRRWHRSVTGDISQQPQKRGWTRRIGQTA